MSTNEELARHTAAHLYPDCSNAVALITCAINTATAERDREIERLQMELDASCSAEELRQWRERAGQLEDAGKCLAAELCTWAPKEMRGDVLRKWDEALTQNNNSHLPPGFTR